METNIEEFYSQAFARNKGLIADNDQEKLKNSRIAIAGVGAVGSIYVTTLARLGVGKLTLSDHDVYERVNTNRQSGAFSSTLGKEKVEVMKNMALDINPFMDIKTLNKGITAENVDEFLDGADVVLDGIDFFSIETRLILYAAARKHKIPVVCAGPIGFGASLHTFTPDSMSFEEYYDLRPEQSVEEKLLQFGLGLCPALLQRGYYPPGVINLKDKAAPSSILSITLVANMGVTQAFKILTGKKYFSSPTSIQFDPYVEKLRRVNLWMGNRNPIQLLKKWYVKRTIKM